MPKRAERKVKPEFDREAYIRNTNFAPGIDPKAAVEEAKKIHEKGQQVLNHINKSTGRQKPTTKEKK